MILRDNMSPAEQYAYEQSIDGREADYDDYLTHISLKRNLKVNSMNMNQAFPSNYLKASDLQGKKIKVIIDRVEMGEFDNGNKPVLMFKGKDKGLVLNKTNAMVISASYGPESDEWAGKELCIYPAKVQFQGQMTDALRVEVPLEVAESENEIPF